MYDVATDLSLSYLHFCKTANTNYGDGRAFVFVVGPTDQE